MKLIRSSVPFLLVLLNACNSTPKKTELEKDPGLMNSMNGLKTEMDHLFPLLISANEFNKPENQERIRNEVSRLERISSTVTHAPVVQKQQDPMFESLSREFQQDIKRSYEAFEQGKREYARQNLLNVTAYCIECHARIPSGKQFMGSGIEQALQSLKPIERGEYLMATRQVEPALKEFEAVIQGGLQNGVTALELDRAIHLALTIAIRIQSNPETALRIAETVSKSSNIPFYLKTHAAAWKQSSEEWKKEPKRRVFKRDPLKLSRDLIKKARSRQQSVDDRNGEIEMLRVQALLRPVVASEKKPERLGEALYLLGIAYDSVRDQAMWSLHEDYFEGCIRRVPHTDWSKRCFQKLEESTLLGYTGSAGTSLPEDVQKRLEELRQLAL